MDNREQAKYLQKTPLQRTFNTLLQEATELSDSVFPSRRDIDGNEHRQTFGELVYFFNEEPMFRYIPSDQLLYSLTNVSLLDTKSKVRNRIGFGIPSDHSSVNTARRLVLQEFGQSRPMQQPLPMLYAQFQKVIVLNKWYKTKGHAAEIYSCVFDQTGSRFFTGTDDNLVKVWCAKTGYLLHTIRAHASITRQNVHRIVDLEIDPDNEMLISSSSDKTIRYWCLRTFMPLGYLHVGKEIITISISDTIQKDKMYLLVTCGDGKVRFYHWKGGYFDPNPIVLESGTLAKDEVAAASWNQSGLKVVTGANDGILYLFSILGPQPRLIRLFDHHVAPITCVGFSFKGCRISSGCRKGMLYLTNVEGGNTQSISIPDVAKREHGNTSPAQASICSIIWSCDDSRIISATLDNVVRVWDSSDLSHMHSLFGHEDSIVFLSTHPFNPCLCYSASREGRFFIWNVETGRTIFHVNLDEELCSGALHPSGDRVILCSANGYIHVFGLGTENFNVPSEQFFLLDWVRVREDPQGLLIDDEIQQSAHLVELGELVDFLRVPLPSYHQEHALMARLAPVNLCNYLSEYNYHLRKTAHELSDKVEVEESAVVDKKQLLKRRKQIVVDASPAANPPIVYEMVTYQDVLAEPLVVPASSGDEYSEGDSSTTDEVEENAILDFSPNGSFVEPDSGDSDHEHTPATRRTRQRYQPSEDEEDEFNVRYPLRTKNLMDSLLESDDDMDIPTTSRRTRNSARVAAEDTGDEVQNRKWSERKRRVRSAIMLSESEGTGDDTESIFSEHSIPPSPKESKPKAKPKREDVEITLPTDGWVPESRQPPEWLSKSISISSPYLPQKNDMVVYSKEGHQEFVEKNAAYYPFVMDETLPELMLGKVIDITFIPGVIVYCTVKLAIFSTLEIVEHDVAELPTTEITFFDAPDSPDFLVLWQDFEVSRNWHWEVGDQVVARYNDGNFEGTIIDIHDSTSLWGKYSIEFANFAEKPRFSPWELRPLDSTFATLPTLTTDDKERLLAIINEAIIDANLEPFVYQVPFDQVPRYLDLVAYPIHILLIKERLVNDFYRHKDQVVWEWDRMCQNAFDFNLPRSAIYKLAKNSLAPILRKLIDGFVETEVADTVPDVQQPKSITEPETNGNDSDRIPENSSQSSSPLRIRLRRRPKKNEASRKRTLRRSTSRNVKRPRYDEDFSQDESDEYQEEYGLD